MSDRTLDLVLYGATGFTGRLVAEHLREHAGPEVRWAIAGRRKDALQDLAAELGLDVDVVVADSGDPDSLAAMAASTRVVCTTVGPYARYGSSLVAACAGAGTDYCDLTGEVHWVRAMIDAHGQTAERTGARLLHCCGFDSIPSDMGTYAIQEEMHARHGVYATRVSGRLKAARGGVSGGTVASGVDMLGEAVTDPHIRKLLADPYSLDPVDDRGTGQVPSRQLPFRDHDFNAWAGPFVMASINARIVRRSNALRGHPYGRDFAYDEAMLTGSSPLGALAAAGLAAGLAGGAAVGAVAAALPPARRMLDRVLPDAGTGPSPEAQKGGFFDFRLHAEHPSDSAKSVQMKVVGDRDPGYGSTSKMLGQVALSLAAGESVVSGGSWTPASALGDALLRRLPEHGGVTFTTLD